MEGRRSYFLDLQTLLTQLHDQSCMLVAKTVVAGKAATGYVWLRNGALASCLIRAEDGAEIGGKQALDLLEKCKEWQVQLEQPEERSTFPPPEMSPRPAPMSSVQMPPQPFPFSPTPSYSNSGSSLNNWQPLKQKRELDPSLLQSLPVQQRLAVRMVFTMINGERSLEEIKTRLQLPPGVVDDIVSRLRALDLIG